MNMKELKNLSVADLHKRLAQLREQLRDLRFKIHSKEVKNNHQMKLVKKDSARILTVINQEMGK